MHDEAARYVARTLAERFLAPRRVLEIGSYNVNGSIRPLFWSADAYVGIDLRPGPGVDWVGPASDYAETRFDLVVCCETLEHDPEPVMTIDAAWRALRPGGHLILTAASHTRPPHSCDGLPVVPATEHYQGIHPDDLRTMLAHWGTVSIEHHATRGDVYAVAQKPEDV